MKSIREKFVKVFGEKEAKNIEVAAESHKNGVHDNKGSDPFKWALLICIGYQCMKIKEYRINHSIKTSWIKLKNWIKGNAELDTHDGDVDYLALMAGTYNEYMIKNKKEVSK